MLERVLLQLVQHELGSSVRAYRDRYHPLRRLFFWRRRTAVRWSANWDLCWSTTCVTDFGWTGKIPNRNSVFEPMLKPP